MAAERYSAPVTVKRPSFDGSGRYGSGAALTVEHDVDHPVLEGLDGGEPSVAVEVRHDPLLRLAGVDGDPLGHQPAEVGDVVGVDEDVAGHARHLAERLVHEDLAVAQGETLAGRAGHQQELPHRGGQAQATVATSLSSERIVS